MAKKIKKIIIERDKCISAGSCIAIAPDVFEFDENNIAILKEGWEDKVDGQTILMAAESCPTLAIILEDEDGNQIYPKPS